jgi:hypothetical protein
MVGHGTTTDEDLVEVTKRGTITLPKRYRDASLYEVRPRARGGLELIPQRAVDAAQAWSLSDRWQAMEREANAGIAAGRVKRFASVDDFVAELDRH